MSLPRILSINRDNILEMEIAPEARSLRERIFEIPYKLSVDDRKERVPQIKFENVAAEFFWMSSAEKSNFVLSDQNGPWLTLSTEADLTNSKLIVNGKTIEIPPTRRPLRDFSLFLDASVAELICDNQHAVTTRIYRKPAGPLKITSDLSEKNLYQLSAWQLKPISPNRLTT